jgi:hypothetical protein
MVLVAAKRGVGMRHWLIVIAITLLSSHHATERESR